MIRKIVLSEAINGFEYIPKQKAQIIFYRTDGVRGDEFVAKTQEILLNKTTLTESYLRFLYQKLASTGLLFFHTHFRETAYYKINSIDKVFGSANILNELIWTLPPHENASELLAWPQTYNKVLLYCKDLRNYSFFPDQIDRVPYLSPNLVGIEKEEQGKLPTDTWWYTQSEGGFITRMINSASQIGDLIVGFELRDTELAENCLRLDREFLIIETQEDAFLSVKEKLSSDESIEWIVAKNNS